MRNLRKFLLEALTAALKNPATSERLLFRTASHCSQAIIDFHLAAQYLSQTKTTLSYMTSYFAKFEQNRKVFLEFRITNVGEGKTREIDQVLRQQQSSISPVLEL